MNVVNERKVNSSVYGRYFENLRQEVMAKTNGISDSMYGCHTDIEDFLVMLSGVAEVGESEGLGSFDSFFNVKTAKMFLDRDIKHANSSLQYGLKFVLYSEWLFDIDFGHFTADLDRDEILNTFLQVIEFDSDKYFSGEDEVDKEYEQIILDKINRYKHFSRPLERGLEGSKSCSLLMIQG